MKGKITKSEKKAMIRFLMIAIGTWMIISPIKDWLSSSLSQGIIILIGLGIILLALWLFNIK